MKDPIKGRVREDGDGVGGVEGQDPSTYLGFDRQETKFTANVSAGREGAN